MDSSMLFLKQESLDVGPRFVDVAFPVAGQKLGIDINFHDGKTILITKVNEGAVMAYNRSVQVAGLVDNGLASDELCIVGDRFVEINGVSGNADQLRGAAQMETML